MKPSQEDRLIYINGKSTTLYEPYIPEYMEIIKELIKENLDSKYLSPNKILQNNIMFSVYNDKGEPLKNIDDVNEIYMCELRAWKP